ncbi:ABC-type transport auxiliary lipoprotein family protein [Photobacterium sp. SDRW27]|uniref:PqiC family protein n=1 Tax=Photobacterium obscurum TaxID=2829490 RepID=UPI002244323C|nr:ABC-type transport auxiliary lipoprotein family protein [Photobacterium obscurum]MCW8330220.1 ABC-type transport auxiliary lipoprotein family protein [Photobacterium obscurum]
MKRWSRLLTDMLLAAVLMPVVLTGCSSQPEVVSRTYMLPSDGQGISTIATNQPLLVVRPVEMAEHLSGTGLVYQLSDTEVVQAQQNLWAESIGKQLTRRINLDLRSKQSRYWPTELTPALETSGVPRLQVKFSQFNGHYSGSAKVSGEWLLLDGSGALQGVYPFVFEVPLAQEGYDAQVKALSEGVNRLTSQIAQQLTRLPTES